LVATFKLKKEPKKRTTIKDIQYYPSPEIFRTFKIKKSKRIPLKDTFIQKRSKRLDTRAEVSEIQFFRKRKEGSIL
jgi:hypothetical protein